jgi:hypothetical protein
MGPDDSQGDSRTQPKEPNRARRLAVNPFGDQYPDNDDTKEIILQADGLEISDPNDRHVLLHWLNGNDETGRYTQIVHLTGGPGNYHFHPEQVKKHSDDGDDDTFYNLGSYSRAQRDQIVKLAKHVRFDPKSHVNNCQTWMRDLFLAMVNNDLLPLETFNKVDKKVPLLERVPEDTV